ncbi:MAG TPA: winged helix-turn-helix domain-containing protein [Candidatus Limnocylindrales bacterium]
MTDRDLVALRLTYAPYWDILSAAIRAPGGRPTTAEGARLPAGRRHRLVEAAAPLAALPALRFLQDGVVPSFLAITPDPGEGLEASIERIAAAEPADIERQIAHCTTVVPRRRESVLAAWTDRPRAIDAIAKAFRGSWDDAFGDAWPAIESVHLGDIAQRSLVLANDGPFRLFDDLRPGAWLEGYELCLPNRCEWTYAPAGAGITLVASVFASEDYLAGELPGGRWLLVYPPAGRSLVWLEDGPSADAQMTELIGPVRAQILAALSVPRTTGDIARICGLAPNTASYHLARLREAGMVVASRSGRRSFYRLARRGSAFLSLWGAASDRGASTEPAMTTGGWRAAI